MENEEELIKRVEDAARRGAKQGSKKGNVLWKILPIAIAVILVIAGVFYIKYSISSGWTNLAKELKEQFSFGDSAESHDLVLDNSGIFGYTSADFADAILKDTNQLKKIEVYEAKISDAATLTDTGLANLAIFTKTQVVTYNGTAKYTVDLSKLNKNSVVVDKTHKTIKLKIPHAEREEINIPSSEMEFSDTEHGWLAFGEINIPPEQYAKVESEARSRMERKLDELNEGEKADEFAKKSVWEIYQPIVSSVSSQYKLEVEFE